MKPYLLLVLLSPLFAACAHTPTPQDVEAATYYYDIGVNETVDGNVHAGVKNLRTAVERNPYFPEAHNALGLLYHVSLGRIEAAEASYRRALELKPDFSEAANNLGALYLDLERWEEAEVHFRKALEDVLYPTPHLARGNLGWALYKQGRIDEAIVEIKQSVILQPKFCVGYRNLGLIYTEAGRGPEAQQAFRGFVKHCPDSPEAQLHWGLVSLEKGDQKGALEAFKACWRLAPEGGYAADCAQKVEFLGGELEIPQPAGGVEPVGDIQFEGKEQG